MRTCGPCRVPRGAARRTVPVQELREPAVGRAFRPGLDYLARWGAGGRAASQRIPVPAEVPSCRYPDSLLSRLPGQPGRSAPAHGAGSTAAPCPVTAARARRAPLAGSSAVSPWCRRPRPGSRSHHRPGAPAQGLSPRCARQREAAPAAGRQQPLSRTSACAAPPTTRSSSRAAGDPYRTAFAAISLTAITKSSARPGGPDRLPR
jgi:hypothetical protein